jgi:hypothetical protein
MKRRPEPSNTWWLQATFRDIKKLQDKERKQMEEAYR